MTCGNNCSTSGRVPTAVPGKLAVAAGVKGTSTQAAVLVANVSGPGEVRLSLTNLPWAGASIGEVRVVDERHAFTVQTGNWLSPEELVFDCPPPCVVRGAR